MVTMSPWTPERMEADRAALVAVWTRRQARKMLPIVVDEALVRAQTEEALGQVWPRLRLFDSPAGTVWVIDDPASPVVVLVDTDQPGPGEQASAWLDAVLEHWPEARAVGVEVVPGDPWAEALGGLDGFTSRATNMHLRLDGAAPDSVVDLTPMTQAEFEAFQAWQIDDYVKDLIEAGMEEEVARTQGPAQVHGLLVGGLQTPDTDLLTARLDGVDVGVLWLNYARGVAFVYDVMVREEMRGRGLGRAVMNAGAARAIARGMPGIALNVFAANPRARALYDSLGYQVTADHRMRSL